MTTKVCPKCGSASYQMFDMSVMCINYIITDGFVESNGRTDDGDHISTECVCDECGYTWHPRKLTAENFSIDK